MVPFFCYWTLDILNSLFVALGGTVDLGRREVGRAGSWNAGNRGALEIYVCVTFEMKPGEEFPDLLYLLGLGDQPNLGLGPVLLGLRL